LIQKVYDAMEPGGYLFIGQTESINKEHCPFEHVRPSVYRKREER
jgi:chemotaxis protein methyltransferase CheR